MGPAFAIMFVLLGLTYFLPSVIAILKWRHNSVAIIALNIFLGWTLIGWVVALVWALTSSAEPQAINVVNNINNSESSMPTQATVPPTSVERVFKVEERILSNDAFKLFLLDAYPIKRNDLLNKFVLHEKIYDSLAESLDAARVDYERKVLAQEKKQHEDALKLAAINAEAEALNEKNFKKNESVDTSILVVVGLLIIGGVIYALIVHKPRIIETQTPVGLTQPAVDANSPNYQAPQPTPSTQLPLAHRLAPAMPTDVAVLADKEMALDGACRQSQDQSTMKECDARPGLLRKIESKGWCWGHKDDANAARTWVKCAPGDVPRPKFGANCVAAFQGCVITGVAPDGIAAQSSLRQGDVMLSFKGVAVRTPQEATSVINTIAPGQKVDFVVSRNGQQLTLAARF